MMRSVGGKHMMSIFEVPLFVQPREEQTVGMPCDGLSFLVRGVEEQVLIPW